VSTPRLLDGALLGRFEASLRGLAVPVDDLLPGLTDDEIDAITEPEDLHLPDEVRAWWRWHNGAPPHRYRPTLPTREMYSLQEAVRLKTWLPSDGERRRYGLLPIDGHPHIQLQCSEAGPVGAPVWMSLDWAMPIERKLDSFGELVWIWICDVERGVWVPDPNGGWANQQPMWEQGPPDDVKARGIW